MKINILRVSSKLLLGSLAALFVALLGLPGYASAAAGGGGIKYAVNAADCSGNVVTASINGGSVTFTNKFEKDMAVGVASYRVLDSSIDTQQLFDSKTSTVPACGVLTLTVSLPRCNYQLDAFLGPVLQSMQGQRYGSRLLAAKDPGASDFCPVAVADVNSEPSGNSAVLDTAQIPGLPNTGLGNGGLNTAGDSPVWPVVGLVIGLVSGIITLGLFGRRKIHKKS